MIRTKDKTQESVVTIWKDGSWRLWGAMDDYYARCDPDYLVGTKIEHVLAFLVGAAVILTLAIASLCVAAASLIPM